MVQQNPLKTLCDQGPDIEGMDGVRVEFVGTLTIPPLTIVGQKGSVLNAMPQITHVLSAQMLLLRVVLGLRLQHAPLANRETERPACGEGE